MHIRKIKRSLGILAALISMLLAFVIVPRDAMAAGRRLISETTQDGRYISRIEYSYDKAGHLAQKTEYQDDKVESVTEYHYYPDGRLLEELWRGHLNLYWHYDSCGTVIERDETGGIGSPAFSLPYMGDVVHEEYDAAGHITRFENRSGETGGTSLLQYEYDSRGRILTFRSGARVERYDYRPDGSFVRTRDDKSMDLFITEYYNADGLRTQSDWRRTNYSSTTYFTYDKSGNLIRRENSDGNSVWTWKYDEHGNEIEECINGKVSCTHTYSYDRDGFMLRSERRAGDFVQITAYQYE